MLGRAEELLQLGVEGLERSVSSLRKAKAPWPLTDLPATSPNGLVDSTPSFFEAMSAIESAVSAAASARPAWTAATRLAWSGS